MFPRTHIHTHSVPHDVCQNFTMLLYEAFWVKKQPHQHMPKYQLSAHYKHLSVSRHCMASVFINHPHVYSHHWQTLLTPSLHSFWSTDLACKVTRSCTSWQHLGGAQKRYCLPAQTKANIRTLALYHKVC